METIDGKIQSIDVVAHKRAYKMKIEGCDKWLYGVCAEGEKANWEIKALDAEGVELVTGQNVKALTLDKGSYHAIHVITITNPPKPSLVSSLLSIAVDVAFPELIDGKREKIVASLTQTLLTLGSNR